MKFTVLPLVLALGTAVYALPAEQAKQGLVTRDMPEGTIDCGYCNGMLNFCFQNGHTQGQEGCQQTCREHVCHRTPLCKKCRGEFDRCPEKSRYHN